MKWFGKLVLCLLAVAVTGYLFLVDYPALLASLSSDAEATDTTVSDAQATDQTAGIDGTTDSPTSELTEEANALRAELESLYQQCDTTRVALCFEQISELVYSDIYPVLSAHGETGTVVFHNGWLTGDNGRIQTSEFNTMVGAGWSYAVSGDASLELTGTEDEMVAAWQDNLETYMERIRVRTGVVPTAYFFREGEYLAAYDEVLEEEGFTVIRYFPQDAAGDDQDSGIQKIVGIVLSEDTQTDELMETLKAYPGAVLVAQVVVVEDYEEGQITLGSYLGLLEELRESDAITITTFDNAVEAAADEKQWQLRTEIEKKEAELERIENQLQG